MSRKSTVSIEGQVQIEGTPAPETGCPPQGHLPFYLGAGLPPTYWKPDTLLFAEFVFKPDILGLKMMQPQQ